MILAIAMLLVTACAKKEVKEEKHPKPEKETDTEKPAVMYKAPFTGIDMKKEVTSRPIIATINNHPLARPQSGLSEADIVYELAAEGNVTRFLALFQSELPDEIGPIRSARDYFVQIAKGLDAFYVAHGYSPDAKKLIDNNVVDNINGMQYDGTLFQRSKERKAPHNSYISGDNILKGAEKVKATMETEKKPTFVFFDSIENVEQGDPVTTVTVQYGSDPNFKSTYAYESALGKYTRTVNGVKTVDKHNDKNVELSNILVFETAHKTIDSEGRQDVDIQSGGNAYLFHAGVMKQIQWKNVDGVLMPMENGEVAKLVPGKTWIHIVSTTPGMETSVTHTP